MPTRLRRPCNLRWHLFLSLSIMVLLCLPASWRSMVAAPPPPTVGELGDPARLQFTGCDRVPADHVRHAIRMDWRLQLASSPSAPQDRYVKLLAERLKIAYSANGFAEADVNVALNAKGDALVVRVTEGPQRLTGPVKVEGKVEGINTKAIIKLISAPVERGPSPFVPIDEGAAWMLPTVPPQFTGTSLERNKPLWTEGEAIKAIGEDKKIRDRVTDALQRQGRHLARFTLERRDEKDRINLVVSIADAGPQLEITAWEVKGLAINSREQFDQLLGKPPFAATLETLQTMRQELWDSGRFIKHDLTIRPDPAHPGRATLLIDLIENPAAPPLGRPLDEKQQIVLRFGNWLHDQMRQGRELFITNNAAEMKTAFIIAAERGVGVRVKIAPGIFAPEALEGSMIATGRLFAVVGPYGRSYIAPNITSYRVVPHFTIVPNAKQSEEHPLPASVSVGTALEERKGDDMSPVADLIFAAAPAALLQVLDPAKSKSELVDGVLQIQYEKVFIRINAKTGELVEMRFDPTEGQAEPTRVIFDAGALDKWAKELAASDALNMHEAALPIGSLVSFMAHGWCAATGLGAETPAIAQQRLAAAAVVAKMLSAKSLEPLDIAWRQRDLPEITFHIPHEAVGGFSDMYLAAAPLADFLFKRGSWPWTLTRELAFLLGGQGNDFQREVTRIYADEEVGPLGHLIIATLFEKAGFAPVASLFARQGLTRLNAKSFREDCRYLLKGGSPWMTMLSQVLANFQALKQAEVEVLAAAMPKEHAAALLTFWRQLQPQDGRTADETLDTALEAIWESTLKQLISDRLRALTGAT